MNERSRDSREGRRNDDDDDGADVVLDDDEGAEAVCDDKEEEVLEEDDEDEDEVAFCSHRSMRMRSSSCKSQPTRCKARTDEEKNGVRAAR